MRKQRLKKVKNKRNNILSLLILMLFSGCILSGCSSDKVKKDDEKLSIVTTLFPQYDFARHIAGDKAEVILLLSPGTEAHDYDPTPTDMISINDADLFIYTGEGMEAWAATILKSIDNENLNVLDVSEGIELEMRDEDEHNHDEHNHGSMTEEEYIAHMTEEHHESEYDPHIWTSPVNAVKMIDNILENIIKVDPDNREYYKKNAEKYKNEIMSIDKEIREVVENAKYDTIYFGGRFALLYFVREYGLKYESAFDSCSSETEPSASLVAHIIDEMKENGAKTVFYEELGNPKTAEIIAEEIDGNTLLLHSCHNLTKDEFEAGETYASIMKKNMENLRIGLN